MYYDLIKKKKDLRQFNKNNNTKKTMIYLTLMAMLLRKTTLQVQKQLSIFYENYRVFVVVFLFPFRIRGRCFAGLFLCRFWMTGMKKSMGTLPIRGTSSQKSRFRSLHYCALSTSPRPCSSLSSVCYDRGVRGESGSSEARSSSLRREDIFVG